MALIKINTHYMFLPISILINKSLENGEVPDFCKIDKVVPIYKDKENCTNYRPISLLLTYLSYSKKLFINVITIF